MAKLMFNKFDADHSGSIDKEEGKNVFIGELKRMGMSKIVFNQEQFDEWFAKADENNDGTISFEEACHFCNKYFKKHAEQKEEEDKE